MASTTDAITVLNNVVRLLADLSNRHWPLTTLLTYLNNAQLEVVTRRPGIAPKWASVQLVAGLLQTLPADGISLIDIPWNMGAGTTIGAPINDIDVDMIRKRYPSWTTEPAAGIVKAFIYNPEVDIRSFFVYPPQPVSPQFVQLVYCAVPTAIANTNVGTKITVPDFCFNALVYFTMFLALMEDSEVANQGTKAEAYFKLFTDEVAALVPAGNPKAAQ